MKVSVVIPANNEADSIGEIVRSCSEHCEEVIVVDDGSTDATSSESKEAGAIVVSNNSRLGIVKSLAHGLKVASGDIIVTLDGDGQHNPSEIGALVRPIVEGWADLVLGRRNCGLPFSERAITKLVSFRVQCRDVGTGFRAVRGEVARKMHLWGICVCGSFVLEAYKYGARVTEVQITLAPRKHGKSHWSPYSRAITHGKQLLALIPRMLI